MRDKARDKPARVLPDDQGLTPAQQAQLLLRWLDDAIAYSRRKRTGFRSASSVLKIATLALSAASTIILGIQNLDFWTGIGFALVALATVVSAVEPFFNWRSRWVLMEEQLHRFYRLQEDLAMEMARTRADDVPSDLVARYYTEYCAIWESSSRRWLEFRKSAEQG